MKKHLLILLLPFLFVSCVSSKRIIYLSTMNLNKPDQVNLQEYEKKYGDYDAVFLDVNRSYEHTGTKVEYGSYFGSNDWNFSVVYNEKYLVLNPDNDKYTTFVYNVGSSANIGNFYLKVTSPEGKVTIYGLKDCKKETDSEGEITYKFIYPDIQKGSIIDEGIETTYNLYRTYIPLQHQIQLQFSVPCEHIVFNYAYPDWWKIQRKKISEDDNLNILTKNDPDNNKTTLSYIGNNIPAVDDELYSPFYKEMANYLEFMVTSLSMGMRRYESSKNWNDLGELFKDYAMNKDGFLSSMVSDTTEYLIENCKTEFEKVDKIVSYIQKNIEVDPTFTDKSFKNILNNKKGDVLSINGLAQSMLSKAGFKAEFLLIHTASEGYFDKDYINKNQFTMPAIRTYIDDKEYILFPYLKYLPVGLLPNDVQGQTVLVISNDANAVLDKIGSANVEDDKYHESYNLKITEDGNIKVTEEKSIDGLLAYYMRKKILDLNSDEKEKFVKNIISYNEGDVKFEDFKILNEKDYKKPLIIKSDYAIDNLITITPEEIILQTAGLFTPSPMENKKFKNEKRKNPIKIYNNLDYTKDISINYPDNWKVQSDLKDVDYKNTFGEVKSHFEISDGNLKASQQQFLHRTLQQKDKFDELKEILGSNSKITIPAIVFANKSNLN